MVKNIVFSMALIAILFSCGEKTQQDNGSTDKKSEEAVSEVKKEKPKYEKPEDQPDRIVVQHILISFKGRGVPKVTRGKEEAKKLAEEIYVEIQQGKDFDTMVKKYTDDSYPGIYPMVNFGVEDVRPGENRRQDFIPAFGDVGFLLAVGEVGLAPFDEKTSPYGWHIIKRIK